jgi:hypothetical protein
MDLSDAAYVAHTCSTEPGWSGAGVFSTGSDRNVTVIGVHLGYIHTETAKEVSGRFQDRVNYFVQSVLASFICEYDFEIQKCPNGVDESPYKRKGNRLFNLLEALGYKKPRAAKHYDGVYDRETGEGEKFEIQNPFRRLPKVQRKQTNPTLR